MSASYVVGVLCCLELPGHALVTIPNMITVLVALCAGLAPSRTIAAQVQTRLLVQAIDPLVVDLPEPSRRNSTTARRCARTRNARVWPQFPRYARATGRLPFPWAGSTSPHAIASPLHRRGERSRDTARSDGQPTACVGMTSEPFCQNILQHDLVQAQVGDQLLELVVLFLKLAQSAQLGDCRRPWTWSV